MNCLFPDENDTHNLIMLHPLTFFPFLEGGAGPHNHILRGEARSSVVERQQRDASAN
jgi:hypothetical protein